MSYFVLSLGIFHDDIAVKDSSRKLYQIDIYLNRFISVRIVLAILLYIIITISSLLIYNELIRSVLLIYGATLFSQAFYINWYYRVKELAGPIAISQIISSTINLILVILIMANYTDPIIAIILITAKEILNALLLFILFKNSGRMIHFDFNLSFANDVFKKSQPLVITAILILINANVDQFLLGVLTKTKEVGLYSAAYKITFLLLLPASVILQAAFPQISKQKTLIQEDDIITDFFNLMYYAGTIVTLICFLFSQEIILLVYGANYINSIELLSLLSFSIIIIYASKMYSCQLLALDEQKYFMLAILIGALFNVILNIIFIPQYLAKGAVIATLISEFIILLLTIYFYRKVFHSIRIKKIVLLLFLIATIVLLSELFIIEFIIKIILLIVSILVLTKLFPLKLFFSSSNEHNSNK